jgi:cytochrome b
MNQPADVRQPEELDSFTILLHFGLMIFGVLAWLTGYWAGDYKKVSHLGFMVHKMLGMGVVVFVAARLFHGFCGSEPARFANWVPYTPERLKMILEDIRGLLTLKLPEGGLHRGLEALWESFGLAVFTWMTATGLLMFLFLIPGQKARGAVRLVKELHEFGEWLVPVFLAVHVGAVILHALVGDHRWRTIFFLRGINK